MNRAALARARLAALDPALADQLGRVLRDTRRQNKTEAVEAEAPSGTADASQRDEDAGRSNEAHREPVVSTEVLEAYQRSLPYVRGHDEEGQWELFDAGASIAELVADPVLAKINVDQLQLFDCRGVLRGANWRRESAKGSFRNWKSLQLCLDWRNTHRGARWEKRHLGYLDDLRAQTWNAAEVGRRQFRVRWVADAFVDPFTGGLIEIPRNPTSRRLLQLLIDAHQSGAGGIMMSLHDWAAELGCCSRSLWNHRKRLGDLIRSEQTWVPADDDQGSQRGMLLLRVGPAIERLAAIEAFARRRPPRRSGIHQAMCRRASTQLRKRAARRRFDVSGSYYRGQRGCAVSTQSLNRQNFPHSPPLSGLLVLPSDNGGPRGTLDPFERSRFAPEETIAVPKPPPPPKIPIPTVPAPKTIHRAKPLAKDGQGPVPTPDDISQSWAEDPSKALELFKKRFQ